MNPFPPYLILTVGTGTAGPHSNLAAGLRRTVELIAPAKYWLIPSTDVNSITNADLVREEFISFEPWSPDSPYLTIHNPDSLEDCRRTVREVIARIRQEIPRNTRLVVNPTSGTKQMSVGAALAALDEGLGELVFTVGKRADGVVMTGSETLETFNASIYHSERDLGMAGELFQAGAFFAAHAVLSRHPSMTDPARVALCLHEWERQNYPAARAISTKSAALAPLRGHLESLNTAAKSGKPSALVVADLLHTAEILHQRGEYEASLTTACRALETGLRLALFLHADLSEPYALSAVCTLPLPPETRSRLRQISPDGERVILGLKQVAEILKHLDHPVGATFFEDKQLRDLIGVRNELTHQLRAVTETEARMATERVGLLLKFLALPEPPRRPDQL